MRETRRSSWVLFGGLGLLVLGLVAYAIPSQAPETPLRVHYASTGGGVLFPHEAHTEMAVGCAHCHHEMLSEEPEGSCERCHHPESFAVVEWEDEDQAEYHMEFAEMRDPETCLGCHDHASISTPVHPPSRTSCAECHEADELGLQAGHSCSACHAVGETDQVMACRTCHGSGEGDAPTCDACHAGDDYTADMLEHGELTAIEDHTCGGCHVASRHGTALHNRCGRCHEDTERFTYFTRSLDDGGSVCKTCHLKD